MAKMAISLHRQPATVRRLASGGRHNPAAGFVACVPFIERRYWLPARAVALIKAGALALFPSEDPTCTPRIYLAGEAFVDSRQGHVHLARNPSATENVEVWAT